MNSSLPLASEHINVFDSLKIIDRSSHRTRILSLGCRGNIVAFAGLKIWYSVTNIHHHPTLSKSVLEHNVVAPSQIAIGGEGPWNLPITLLIFAQCLRKWQLIPAPDS